MESTDPATGEQRATVRTDMPRVAIIGGGPAGLMAAEVARAAGADVQVYDRLGSVGRKFLARAGGLNLTHSEGAVFAGRRYGARRRGGRWLTRRWRIRPGTRARHRNIRRQLRPRILLT
jgi:NADPH-dependent 2,4-dienoyl-CoA reductase/sulfur reductase-like enzyme